MDDHREAERLRALLLASRNHMDSLWRLVDTSSGSDMSKIEGVLKLIGAIDYVLGIEPYTMEMSNGAGRQPMFGSSSAPAYESANDTVRPLDIG